MPSDGAHWTQSLTYTTATNSPTWTMDYASVVGFKLVTTAAVGPGPTWNILASSISTGSFSPIFSSTGGQVSLTISTAAALDRYYSITSSDVPLIAPYSFFQFQATAALTVPVTVDVWYKR